MPEVVVVGAAIIDVLVHPADGTVFETGSYPADDIRMSVGADALNEATVLAGLGNCVQLETVIGRDAAGDYIVSHCEKRGIGLRDNCVNPSVKTGINVVLVGEDGRRHFLTSRNGSLRSLRLQDIQIPFAAETKLICFASIFVFPHMGTQEMTYLFRQAKLQGLTVCADMTKCKNKETAEDLAPALRYVDYLFPNDEEAMLLTGEKTAEKAAERLGKAGAKNVIVKCGAKGCYVRTPDKVFWSAAAETECVDTTGAGDSFVAGFIHALLQKKSIEDCAEYANICGAQAVKVIGATEWV